LGGERGDENKRKRNSSPHRGKKKDWGKRGSAYKWIVVTLARET